jgi:hypothetical protein
MGSYRDQSTTAGESGHRSLRILTFLSESRLAIVMLQEDSHAAKDSLFSPQQLSRKKTRMD